MSLKALVGIAGDALNVPGSDIAISAAIDLAQAVQNVKIYRTQCKDLSERCIRLLLAFREKCRGLEGTQVMAAADEVTCIIERAHKKAANWAAMSRARSFVNQGEIKSGLEQLYREIDLCAQQFNIASSAELHRGQAELQLIHERDVTENREILQNILRSVDGLRDVLALNASDPNAVQNIMQTIQEELQQQIAQPDQQRDLQQGLYEIHRQTQFLPPMIDLTGQVEKVSKYAVAFGAYNDVFTGLWLGEEKVALKFARALNHTAKARKRFHKEVEIWRDLQHPHISRLYGIVYFEEHIYSVSPWMENGSAFDFINSREDVINRLAILRDVASGMEYLHMRNVVHGDLRAANILIGDDGKACVSDFGLSKVIEQVAPEMSSSTNGDSPIRWQARELIKPEEDGGPVCVSPSTDVWSYGMLCLEIMTGKKPYYYRPRDANVIADLVERRLPERPTDEAVVARGLDDQLWGWILRCWDWEPQERPPMATLKRILRSLSSGVHLSTPILNNSLSESPKSMPNELSPVTERIPLSRKTPSLQSSGSEPTVAYDPSSVSRQALFSLPSTSPKASAFNDSSSSMGSRYYRGQTVPVQSPSSGSRHLSSVSPTPGHNAYSSLGPTPDTGGSLGLIIGQTPYVPSQRQPSSDESVRLARTYSSLRHETHNDRSDTIMRRGSSPPRQPSLAELNQLSANDPLNLPLTVNVEGSDSDVSAISSPFSGPTDLPLRKLSLSTPRSAGLLYSPRLALSEEHSEGGQSGGSSSSVLSSSVESPPRCGRIPSLSDSIPPRSSLTDFSDLDCNSNFIKYNKDGSVKAGSLVGLVDRLLKDTEGGYTRDQEFREVFLTTHRLFASTRDILRLLIRRFVLANSDQSMHAKDRAGTRFMTLNIINQLLKGHYAKAIGHAVLDDLRAFLQEIAEPVLLLKTARNLTGLVEDLLAASTGPRVTSSTLSRSETKPVRTSDISPLDLAVALSELEGEKYKAITATDCISYLLHKDGPSNVAEANLVAEARATNNKIVSWVKKSVIKSDRMENRGDTLRFFVNTAAECRKLHNYSSMSALLAGIDSHTVTRLKLTRGCLDKHMREVQKQLSALLEIGHNHRAYRAALPDPKKAACLPLLAVHLKDLQSVYERLSRQIVVDDKPMINFEKFTAVHDNILTILSFQVPVNGYIRGDREQQLGTLLYLQEQLAATHLGRVAEDKMEARSLELQKQEDRDYEHRVTELAAVGFRTARGSR
ncbi:hypothetical protein M0805_003867 [Coniferiporia weirii]|nr:hypothetical protein M0805_003867 [Coniferiporia weirii]